MTPARIELATFRFVAQHLNHCATTVLHTYIVRLILHNVTTESSRKSTYDLHSAKTLNVLNSRMHINLLSSVPWIQTRTVRVTSTKTTLEKKLAHVSKLPTHNSSICSEDLSTKLYANFFHKLFRSKLTTHNFSHLPTLISTLRTSLCFQVHKTDASQEDNNSN